MWHGHPYVCGLVGSSGGQCLAWQYAEAGLRETAGVKLGERLLVPPTSQVSSALTHWGAAVPRPKAPAQFASLGCWIPKALGHACITEGNDTSLISVAGVPVSGV